MSPDSLSIEVFADRWLRLLPRLLRESWLQDRALFALEDLSLPQLWMLEYLAETPARTMRELAQCLGLTNSTVTGLVDQLERRGLVSRQRSEDDRRVIHVGLTGQGSAHMARIRRHKRAMVTRWYGRLSARERGLYLAMVEKVVAGLDEAPAAANGARRHRKAGKA